MVDAVCAVLSVGERDTRVGEARDPPEFLDTSDADAGDRSGGVRTPAPAPKVPRRSRAPVLAAGGADDDRGGALERMGRAKGGVWAPPRRDVRIVKVSLAAGLGGFCSGGSTSETLTEEVGICAVG